MKAVYVEFKVVVGNVWTDIWKLVKFKCIIVWFQAMLKKFLFSSKPTLRSCKDRRLLICPKSWLRARRVTYIVDITSWSMNVANKLHHFLFSLLDCFVINAHGTFQGFTMILQNFVGKLCCCSDFTVWSLHFMCTVYTVIRRNKTPPSRRFCHKRGLIPAFSPFQGLLVLGQIS